MDVLAGEGELSHRLNDHVRVSRGGIPYGDSGREQCEVDELTPIHRKIHDLVFGDYRADLGTGGFCQFCCGFDFHFLNHFSRRERKAKLRSLSNLERDVFRLLSKARKLNSDLIFSGRQRGDGIFAVIRTLRGARESGGRIGSRNTRLGYTAARSIGYPSRERGVDCLAPGGAWRDQHKSCAEYDMKKLERIITIAANRHGENPKN